MYVTKFGTFPLKINLLLAHFRVLNTHKITYHGLIQFLLAGKTLLAKAVANQTSATFLRVVGSELIQKYLVSIITV